MGYQSKVTSKGQTTIPSEVRKAMDLSVGDELMYVPCEDGSYRIYAKNLTVEDVAGILPSPPNGKSYPGDKLSEAIEQAIGDAMVENDDRILRESKT